MRRLLICSSFVIAGLLASATTAFAEPGEGHNPQGKQLGVVAPKGHGGKSGGGSTLLVYHGGPVMLTNDTYLVFWGPSGYSFDPGYVSLINRYFGDVAADSGKATNVYSVGTQYSDASNKFIQYASTFKASVVDTKPYPANGCKDHRTVVCLSDAQLQTELQSLIGANAWSTGTGAAYFIFTPPNVGSCASGVGCAFTTFCAYHSWIVSGASTILYANIPYADQAAGCSTGQQPNGTTGADSTLDSASHEHNEMITDPIGTGWFTNGGFEQGDLCNTAFGSPVAGSPPLGSGTAYNQLINSNPYWIQEEWSNVGAACLQRYP